MKTEIEGIVAFLAIVLIMELFVGMGIETFVLGCVFIFVVNTLRAIVGVITQKSGD